jgi:hypothetical protein
MSVSRGRPEVIVIAAVLMTQSLPFGEPRFMGVYDRFERAVYAQ